MSNTSVFRRNAERYVILTTRGNFASFYVFREQSKRRSEGHIVCELSDIINVKSIYNDSTTVILLLL